MIQIQSVQARVRAGVAFLDAVYGQAWRKKVNVGNLRLQSSQSCPLGQTDGNYEDHKKLLGLTNKSAFNLGFHANKSGRWKDATSEAWRELTNAWKKALRKKRA